MAREAGTDEMAGALVRRWGHARILRDAARSTITPQTKTLLDCMEPSNGSGSRHRERPRTLDGLSKGRMWARTVVCCDDPEVGGIRTAR